MRTLGRSLTCLSVSLLASLVVQPLGAQGIARADSGCVAVSGPDAGSAASEGAAGAMRAGAASAPAGGATASGGLPDVRLFAAVSAEEVRFTRQPRICVRLRGDVRLDSVRVVGRRNLASPVVANTTYRNVYVAVEILGHLEASCIASRITGSDSVGRDRCAALELRSGSSTPPPDPPRS
jgi:hypothetical protein